MKHKTTFKTAVAVDDNWRSWIAENLLLGVHPDAIAGVLASNGIAPLVARGEVEAARRSPYLRGVGRLANRTAKRDWVLGIQATLDRMGEVGVPRKAQLAGEDFFASTTSPTVRSSSPACWTALQRCASGISTTLPSALASAWSKYSLAATPIPTMS